MPRGFADPSHLAAHGNRAGRPVGHAHALKVALATITPEDATWAVNEIVSKAKSGNVQCLLWLGDRFVPSLKPIDIPQPFPLPAPDKPITSLSELASHLVRCVADGSITPDTADKVGRLVLVMTKLQPEPDSLGNFEDRLKAIEHQISIASTPAPGPATNNNKPKVIAPLEATISSLDEDGDGIAPLDDDRIASLDHNQQQEKEDGVQKVQNPKARHPRSAHRHREGDGKD